MPAILFANPSIIVYDYSEQETMLICSNIQIQQQNAKREGKLPRQL